MQHNTEVHCEGYTSDYPLPFTPTTVTVMYAEMVEQLQQIPTVKITNMNGIKHSINL